ncbi:hypothetical protein KXW38_002051, partial [Aspergillus fumigatus]
HVRARAVGRAEGRRRRGQCAVAAHDDRHRRRRQSARRRRHDPDEPHARDHGRCGARDPHKARARVHRQFLHRRQDSLRQRRQGFRALSRRPVLAADVGFLRARGRRAAAGRDGAAAAVGRRGADVAI